MSKDDMIRHFTEHANKAHKILSSLIIMEIQIKTSMNYHYTPLRKAKTKIVTS